MEGYQDLTMTVHDKNTKIVMKCRNDVELKHVVKRGKLRLQYWHRAIEEGVLFPYIFEANIRQYSL